ncbi:MAG: TSUP family transporter [Bacteroidales bacterium]|nr:TSUP family transporter [Bacteroidales bacterium]
MEYGILIISGFIGGIIAGMLGLGGGIFYILILPLIMTRLGIPAEEASPFVVANSLIGIAFASGVSIITQYSKLKTYFKESLRIGIPATIISLLTTYYVVHSIWFSIEVFNILVILLMLFILFQMLLNKKAKKSTPKTDEEIKANQGVYSGGIAGLVSALSGLGGGIVIIPILRIHLKQSLQKAKIISLAIIFISSTFISVQNMISTPIFHLDNLTSFGFVIPSIAIPIIIGVAIGSPLGVKFSKVLSENVLNKLFSLFVLLVLMEKTLNLF